MELLLRTVDKVAIVTGAGSGMGATHVRALAGAGAKVLGMDLVPGECTALSRDLGHRFQYVQGDVCSARDWSRVIQECADVFGPPSVLVNNAGVASANRLESVTEPEYERIISVNQVGPFLGMQAVIPGMKQRGHGSIINIVSTAGMVGFPDNFAYVASKWALRGMTKAAALELAEYGIRVNAICPGETDTPLLRADPTALPPETSRLKRWAKPSEISAAVVFLTSHECDYMSGAEMVIDGTHTAG